MLYKYNLDWFRAFASAHLQAKNVHACLYVSIYVHLFTYIHVLGRVIITQRGKQGCQTQLQDSRIGGCEMKIKIIRYDLQGPKCS